MGQDARVVIVCSATGKYSNRPGKARWIVAGVLERAPGALEEGALLGVRYNGLVRVHSKKGGVKGMGIRHDPASGNVRGIADDVGRHAFRQELVRREELDRLHGPT